MHFAYNEEENMLQTSLKSFFANEYTIDDARKFMEEKKLDLKIKGQLEELGIIDVLDPEEKTNFGVIFAAIALMEAGRKIMPFPLIEQMLASYICRADSRNFHQDCLPTIAWETCHDIRTARLSNDQITVSGSFTCIPFGEQCKTVLVAIPQEKYFLAEKNKTVFAAITLNDPAVTLEDLEGFDETYPLYTLKLNDYFIDNKNLILLDQEISGISMDKVKSLAQLLLSAEMVGGMDEVLKLTVEYTKDRNQFGQEIAKFQAIKHMAAEMYLLIESAKAAVEYAAWALENGEADAIEAVLIAKSYTSEAYAKVVEFAIQIHGGIGFTWEHPLHLYLKRAQRSSLMLENSYKIKEKLAASILDPQTMDIKVRG